MIPLVIVGGDQPRSISLYKELVETRLFNVSIQPRISEADLPKRLREAPDSLDIYGRVLSASEKCCAFAHQQAQNKLLSTGGIILEDDAVVLDYKELAFYGASALKDKESILLNLSTLKCEEEVDWIPLNNSRIRTFGPSSLAVGYAASSLGMRQLVDSNADLHYLADWPPTSARHLRLKKPLVAHGKLTTKSLISMSSNRSKISFWKLILDRNYFAAIFRIRQKIYYEVTRIILFFTGAAK